MQRSKLLPVVLCPVIALNFLSCALSIEDGMKKDHPAYLAGEIEAEKEWGASEATVYLYGLVNRYEHGFDRETGLVIKLIAGDTFDSETDLATIQNRAAGHNDRIRELIAEHGVPKYSRKKWVDEICDPDKFYHEQEGKTEPTVLSDNGKVYEANIHLFRLVGTPTDDPDGSEVRIEMKTGKKIQDIGFPLGHYAAEHTELLMGPDGSDLVFFRWSRFGKCFADIESLYGVLDLRSGEWLRAKILRKEEQSGAKAQKD